MKTKTMTSDGAIVAAGGSAVLHGLLIHGHTVSRGVYVRNGADASAPIVLDIKIPNDGDGKRLPSFHALPAGIKIDFSNGMFCDLDGGSTEVVFFYTSNPLI